MGRLQGKTALITGASRGIGAGIAQRFAAEGARVVITARTLDRHDHLPGSLNDTLAAIAAVGGEGRAVVADLCSSEDRQRLVEETIAAFGAPDILVNNAAANYFLDREKISDKRWHIMFEMNIKAPFDLGRKLIPGMLEKKRGWIVNISTASAELPEGPPFSHHDRNNHPMLYGASKAALNRMTVGLAAELEGSGVVANTLAPLGAVATPGAVALRMLPPQRDMIEGVEDMAEAALFLSLCDTGFTGNICYSLPLLNQQGIATRSLDGSKLYDGFIKGVDD